MPFHPASQQCCKQKDKFCRDNRAFLVTNIILDRHVMVTEIKFWTLKYVQQTGKRKKKSR